MSDITLALARRKQKKAEEEAKARANNSGLLSTIGGLLGGGIGFFTGGPAGAAAGWNIGRGAGSIAGGGDLNQGLDQVAGGVGAIPSAGAPTVESGGAIDRLLAENQMRLKEKLDDKKLVYGNTNKYIPATENILAKPVLSTGLGVGRPGQGYGISNMGLRRRALLTSLGR